MTMVQGVRRLRPLHPTEKAWAPRSLCDRAANVGKRRGRLGCCLLWSV